MEVAQLGVGTVTEPQLSFPYWINWGYPERFYRSAATGDRVTGIGGSPGVAEGVARVVHTVDDFDDVADGDILVCQMTNPAWVVLIKPKIWERHGLKPWIEAAKKRLHHNVLAIALANKLARIAWSVLARGRNFEVRKID